MSYHLLSLGTAAHAYEFYKERGGWSISETVESCGMSLGYEGLGATEVIVVSRTNRGSVIAITNSGLSIEDGKGIRSAVRYRRCRVSGHGSRI